MFRTLAILVAAIVFVSGCGTEEGVKASNEQGTTLRSDLIEPNVQSSASLKPLHYEDNLVIATVGSKSISLGNLNHSIQFSLFDLEWRMYELRRSRLEAMVTELQKAAEPNSLSEILLTPPTPPRIDLPLSAINYRGHYRYDEPRSISENSIPPIALSIFCSFQSSHCARLQPILIALANYYGDILNFNFFDYPQHFHREGKNAANAARCANEFGIYQEFQNAIYTDISKLNRHRYSVIAQQLNVDQDAFENCLDDNRYAQEVLTDIELASDMGLGNVPVIFINGLYIKGPQDFEAYQYYIDLELAQLGLENHVDEPDEVESNTEVSGEAKANSNKLNNEDINAGHIEDDYLEDQDNQQRELPATGQMTLSQEWLQEQLINQIELEAHFHPAEHVVDGAYNLIKLKDTNEQAFYQTLGLEDGDVLMQVNGEWVHSGQNPLWDELARKEHVSLILMRKGYPVRYDYRVQ